MVHNMHKLIHIAGLTCFAFMMLAHDAAYSQTSNGKVTTAAPAYTNGNTAPLSLDTTGNLRVTTDSGDSVLANGQATTATPSYTNATPNPLSLDLSGNLRTKDFSTVAQGTALGTIQGGMVMGSVTAAAPTYTTGQISPINLDTAGNQRVNLTTALPAGAATIGNIGTVSTVTAVTAISNALPTGANVIGAININPQTYVFGNVNVTGTTQTCSSVKASAGFATHLSWSNVSTAGNGNTIFDLFDNAAGNATGTNRYKSTQLVFLSVPLTNTIEFIPPITFTTGISLCVTNSIAAATALATAGGY